MRGFTVPIAAAVIVVAGLTVSPASAQMVRESTCSETVGTNNLTYDCHFNVKNYVTGTPVTFNISYSCTGGCGPVLSFGLPEKAFTPAGVAGHLVGGRRIAGGLELTFVFDALKKTGNGAVGNATFLMNLNVDDGSGAWQSTPYPVKVHLGEHSK